MQKSNLLGTAPNATIHAHVYCQQLERLNQALKKKRLVLVNRKGTMFHKNNARTTLHCKNDIAEDRRAVGRVFCLAGAFYKRFKISHKTSFLPTLLLQNIASFVVYRKQTFKIYERVETDISEFFVLRMESFSKKVLQ